MVLDVSPHGCSFSKNIQIQVVFECSQNEDFFSPILVLFSALRVLGVVVAEEDLGVDEVAEGSDDGFEHVCCFLSVVCD